MKTLRIGDTGAEVKELQRLLNQTGANLTIDGHFGEKTKSSVIKFQKKNGLDQDGIVGPKTWLKLGVLEKPTIKPDKETNPAIKIINDCVNEIMALPSFKAFMEMIVND